MSLDLCLPGMLENGEINQDQHDRMRDLFDEAQSELAAKMGPEAAKAAASEAALKQFGAEAAQAKRQAMLQVAAQHRILTNAEKIAAHKGEAFIGMITHSDRAPSQNAEALGHVIQLQALGMMDGVLHKFSRNLAGRVRNRALLRNVVKEAFGEESGDLAAKELASAWDQTAEMLRTRFNEAGGGIGKMEKWGLPQTHNYQAVRAVPFEEWRNFIRPLLDASKMTDVNTGLPMSPQGLELALRSTWEQVSSDGWAFRKPGSLAGVVGKMANRRADARFLRFKDADSWMAYSRRFGRPQSAMASAIDPDGPIFDAMMAHIGGMSRDIGMMETLGPNPAATVRWMGDVLEREAKMDKAGNRFTDAMAKKSIGTLNDVYAELSGTGRAPIDSKIGTFFGAARAMETAGKLGSATISAMTDVAFQATTRAFNGMPVTAALHGYLRQFNPASSADRAIAARIGFGAAEAARHAVSQSRFTGEVVTGEMASRLAEGVLRLSGLSAWTEAGKRAFGVDFMGHLTSESVKKWGTLGGPFRRSLERYGFDERAWDEIRSTPIEKVGGAHWILPANIENRATRERLLGMILTETNYAVPEADLRTRALFNQHLPPKGTLWGEIVRSPLQFKSFGVSMMMTHGRRMMAQQGWSKLKYGAGLAITTTMLGALALQTKNLLRGEDLQPMGENATDPTFWAQSMAQGGGFGLAGDFLQSASDRYQGSLAEYLLGPVAGDVISATKVIKSGVKAAQGQRNSAGRQAQRLVQGLLPGSSLWYAKLAFQRAIADQASHWTDPNYYDSFARMENKARQQGQDYWWKPGETSPDRAPDMANALKNPPPAN